jgi:hypothetical protein
MFTMIAVLPDTVAFTAEGKTGSKGNRLRIGKNWRHALPHLSPTRQKGLPAVSEAAAAVE